MAEKDKMRADALAALDDYHCVAFLTKLLDASPLTNTDISTVFHEGRFGKSVFVDSWASTFAADPNTFSSVAEAIVRFNEAYANRISAEVLGSPTGGPVARGPLLHLKSASMSRLTAGLCVLQGCGDLLSQLEGSVQEWAAALAAERAAAVGAAAASCGHGVSHGVSDDLSEEDDVVCVDIEDDGRDDCSGFAALMHVAGNGTTKQQLARLRKLKVGQGVWKVLQATVDEETKKDLAWIAGCASVDWMRDMEGFVGEMVLAVYALFSAVAVTTESDEFVGDLTVAELRYLVDRCLAPGADDDNAAVFALVKEAPQDYFAVDAAGNVKIKCPLCALLAPVREETEMARAMADLSQAEREALTEQQRTVMRARSAQAAQATIAYIQVASISTSGGSGSRSSARPTGRITVKSAGKFNLGRHIQREATGAHHNYELYLTVVADARVMPAVDVIQAFNLSDEIKSKFSREMRERMFETSMQCLLTAEECRAWKRRKCVDGSSAASGVVGTSTSDALVSHPTTPPRTLPPASLAISPMMGVEVARV